MYITVILIRYLFMKFYAMWAEQFLDGIVAQYARRARARQITEVVVFASSDLLSRMYIKHTNSPCSDIRPERKNAAVEIL